MVMLKDDNCVYNGR